MKSIFSSKIIFWASGVAFLLLNALMAEQLLLSAVLAAALGIAVCFVDLKNLGVTGVSGRTGAVGAVILAMFAWRYHSSMVNSGKVAAICDRMGFPVSAAVAIIAIALSLLSFVFVVDILVLLCDDPGEGKPKSTGSVRVSRKEAALLLLIAAVTIFLCSKSSPLYPFNDWVDADCFMTVGRSILYGKMPYRDLYEQKGPVLYLMHAAAALVSEDTFIGVFAMEILAAFLTLFLVFRTARLLDPAAGISFILLSAAVCYSDACFCHGDSAEELCMPVMAWLIYITVKMETGGTLPDRLPSYVTGLAFAYAFWIKYTLAGGFAGFLLVSAVHAVRKKELKKYAVDILMWAAGLMTVSIPLLAWFWKSGALPDLFSAYFVNNLTSYSDLGSDTFLLGSMVRNLAFGLIYMIETDIHALLLIVLTLYYLVKAGQRKIAFSYMPMVLFAFVSVYIGGQRYLYYSLILYPFAMLGIKDIVHIVQVKLLQDQVRRSGVFSYIGIAVCFVSFCLLRSSNSYLIRYSKEDMPQYKFAALIGEDATLLNYGFLDGGFYIVSGIVPDCRYFCRLNIDLDEMMEVQDGYVRDGKGSLIVTRDEELDAERYRCISEESFYFEGLDHIYRLYRKQEEGI